MLVIQEVKPNTTTKKTIAEEMQTPDLSADQGVNAYIPVWDLELGDAI